MVARRFEPAPTLAALADAWHGVREWVATIPVADLERPSNLDAFSVRDLCAHLSRGLDALSVVERDPTGTPMRIASYVSTYPAGAGEILKGTRALAVELGDDYLAAMDAAWERTQATVATLGDGDPVVRARRGPIRLGDFIATRVLEVIVHADDLAQSLPHLEGYKASKDAERIVVRQLLDVLADNAPGHAVEVRVPPYAAVQCVEGPKHTRGTPPNVVELSPTTWMRLACGRTTWAKEAAAHRIAASGQRADISALLPLL